MDITSDEDGVINDDIPNEVLFHHRLHTSYPGTIVGFRGYRRYLFPDDGATAGQEKEAEGPQKRQGFHRLYIEYCQHGDLGTLITRYKNWRSVRPAQHNSRIY